MRPPSVGLSILVTATTSLADGDVLLLVVFSATTTYLHVIGVPFWLANTAGT